jgi:hypothetical protein
MGRRWTGHMDGEQYIGNTQTLKVHDLDNEQTGPTECQIAEIIEGGNDKPFNSLAAARFKGYSNCGYCLPTA